MVAVVAVGCGPSVQAVPDEGGGTGTSGSTTVGSSGSTGTGTGDVSDDTQAGTSTGPDLIDYEDEIIEGPDLAAGRGGHHAVLLDDGNVFVGGGFGANGPLDSVEIFRPGESDVISGGKLLAARSSGCAVKLHDGRVFIAGSVGNDTEVWNPVDHQVESGPPLNAPAGSGTMCMIADDGAVLVADSNLLGKGYLFERWMPGEASFEELDSDTPLLYQGGHDGALVGDGQKALLIGGGIIWDGKKGPPPDTDLGGAQVYDLTASTFRRVEGWEGQGTIVVDANGNALAFRPSIDGFIGARFRADAESFVDISPTGEFDFSSGVGMRWDGIVLLAGGFRFADGPSDDAEYVAEVRLWDPMAAQITAVANLTQARSQATATRLRDGRIAIIGGVPGTGEVSTKIDIYR